ncbi:hypothetical protein J5N97_025033 [Dioscorea zingiberensis]|uniref:Uncharacterized protein n=1 Tax=Dioscorea zingiberensis TaxID=325984 RepID=A0A9D5H961_9LILI|nr:hypothetical protein J5N97_025033 [Dioscorea zingiberensis]
MGFFRRIAGMLGFSRDDAHDVGHEAAGDGEAEDDQTARDVHHRATKGFSVQVPVAVDRPAPGPVLIPCNVGDGGVQGFRWYSRRLRIDEDGDVADEFLNEVCLTDTNPKFEVKYNTRPAAIRKQVISNDGTVRHSVDFQGRLQWV